MSKSNGEAYISPATLSRIKDMQMSEKFCYVDVQPNDLISVETTKGQYVLAVTGKCEDWPQGANLPVVFCNENSFQQPQKAVLNGSSWGGSMIKFGDIVKGMRLALAVISKETDIWIGDHCSPEVISINIEENSDKAKKMIAEFESIN